MSGSIRTAVLRLTSSHCAASSVPSVLLQALSSAQLPWPTHLGACCSSQASPSRLPFATAATPTPLPTAAWSTSTVSYSQPPQTPLDRHRDAGNAEDSESADAAASASAPEEQLFHFPHPTERVQPKRSGADLRALRSRVEALSARGELNWVRLGKHGITRAFVVACGDLLERHELIRVRISPGCPFEALFVQYVLENLLDAVAVAQRGRTVSLYRLRGLPRPSSSLPVPDEDDA